MVTSSVVQITNHRETDLICLMKYLILSLFLFLATMSPVSTNGQDLSKWATDWNKTAIDLAELRSGGVGRDGIPSIDNPSFISIDAARAWLSDGDPIIVVVLDAIVRFYPLQILTFHEIVNDTFPSTSVSVTFCPLCYSAIVFNRDVEGSILDFGVSGLLRNSDLVMYDRQTESLWQQFTGEAIVGEMVGTTLNWLPSQLLSFDEAAIRYPDAQILSRETGHRRDYGKNPYVNYDAPSATPWAFDGVADPRLSPMTKIVGVKLGQNSRAYSYTQSKKDGVIHDVIDEQPVVVFHSDSGARSALDKERIADSRDEGTVGVFDPTVQGQIQEFTRIEEGFTDSATGSVWDVTGKAISGSRKGMALKPIIHATYFAFAWFAFRPESDLYEGI